MFSILVVDDNRAFGNMFREALKYKYTTTLDTTHLCTQKEIDNAFEWALENKPHLIFLDYMLETGYGSPEKALKLYTDLLTSEQFRICPIYFITGLLTNDPRFIVLKEHIDYIQSAHILLKPFELEAVYSIIDGCMESFKIELSS